MTDVEREAAGRGPACRIHVDMRFDCSIKKE